MDNYIRVYDNVMDGEKCQHLIDMFETDTEHHQIQDCGSGATLTQINLLHSPDTIWRDEVRNLTNVIKSSVQQYKRDLSSKENTVRIGFTITKKIGGAVIRNKIKRRFRSIIKEVVNNHLKKNYDYVIVANKKSLAMNYQDLKNDVIKVVK